MRPGQRLLAWIIRVTPEHKGKGRLVQHWVAHRDPDARASARLPGGATITCQLEAPYDAMVFLGREESAELHWLSDRLKPGQIFVDGGANIGLWTLVAAKQVAPGGRVIAFEPQPLVARRLRENVAVNHLDSVASVVEGALGAASGRQWFNPEAHHNLGHLDPTGDLLVDVVCIDDAGIRPVTGIKLDIEGNELNALLGATKVLHEDRPWLMVEFNTALAGVARVGDWEVYRFLSALGYSAFCSGTRRDWKTRVTGDWTTAGYSNLLFELKGR